MNSLPAHNFSKLAQLKAYNSIYKYDFICLLETYLSTSSPDNLIDIDGYKLILADCPDNIKRNGFCIYCKQLFPVRVISLSYFMESLLAMSYNSKKVMVSVIYSFSSQNNDEFDTCLTIFRSSSFT